MHILEKFFLDFVSQFGLSNSITVLLLLVLINFLWKFERRQEKQDTRNVELQHTFIEIIKNAQQINKGFQDALYDFGMQFDKWKNEINLVYKIQKTEHDSLKENFEDLRETVKEVIKNFKK